MASTITFRVYKRTSSGRGSFRKFMGIVAVPLDVPDQERRAFEMAKSIYGASPYKFGSDYEIEVQGIE
jgi:hypothetical protein